MKEIAEVIGGKGGQMMGWEDNGRETNRSATRYFGPSFSSSAITQSVIHGMPVRNRHATSDKYKLYETKIGRTFSV